ncbi:unnamed protein product [Mytilus coruscus]|uniref:C1q domain-containing protein n=1 Tax=Mytilus coruscus TaxID=42192 RepID=A0A6J8BWB5_MYTCO|nr:unnamed protein product [Mytilus coruscus]
MKLLNMEKKINKEEVISNTVERELLLQKVEKLVKQAVILNTAGSVAFTASLSEFYVVDSNEIIKFDKVWMNIGDGYDPESGVFTAPETGLYMVSSTMRMDNGLKCCLSKNDIKKVGLHGTGTLNTMMMLQNGDRIYIKNYGDGYHARLFGYHLSMFSAFLIKS